MTPVLAFDLETVPDVAGLRQLGQIPSDLSDAEGVEKVQAERLEKGQSDFFLTTCSASGSLAAPSRRLGFSGPLPW